MLCLKRERQMCYLVGQFTDWSSVYENWQPLANLSVFSAAAAYDRLRTYEPANEKLPTLDRCIVNGRRDDWDRQ
jgi:hypothetical protein